MSKINIFKFFAEAINNIDVDKKSKYITWGVDNNEPLYLYDLYNSIVEHSSALDFTENLTVGEGLNITEIDYWDLKKLIFDYLIFGGFTIEVVKNGFNQTKYKYIDISKARIKEGEEIIGFSNNWNNSKTEVLKYKLVTDNTEGGVYYFKNNKSRGTYPRPHYISGEVSLQTLKSILRFHKISADAGFTGNLLIEVFGEDDPNVIRDFEMQINQKFAQNGQKIIVASSKSADTSIKISRIAADEDDTKYESLKIYYRNAITTAHKLTTGNFIDAGKEGTGFNKIEYQEALDIFKNNVINNYRNEIIYAISKLTGLSDIYFIDKDTASVDEQNNVTNNGNN